MTLRWSYQPKSLFLQWHTGKGKEKKMLSLYLINIFIKILEKYYWAGERMVTTNVILYIPIFCAKYSVLLSPPASLWSYYCRAKKCGATYEVRDASIATLKLWCGRKYLAQGTPQKTQSTTWKPWKCVTLAAGYFETEILTLSKCGHKVPLRHRVTKLVKVVHS
jgi:hypothetical protein